MTALKYRIKGIDCANCAKELEEEIGKLNGVKACTLDFGITSHLSMMVENGMEEELERKMRKIIEDDQDHPIIEREEVQTVHCEFTVQGIDCANCAKELEEEIGKLNGVENCTLQFGVTSRLGYDVEKSLDNETESKMRKIIEDDQDHPIIERVEKKTVHCEFTVEGIDCANCAKELEEEIGKLNGVENCILQFGVTSRLSYDVEKSLDSEIESKMRKIIEDDQDHPVITRITSEKAKRYDYRIHNIDCADCARKLCDLTGRIDGVVSSDVDFMTEKLSFTCAPTDRRRIEEEMRKIISSEEPEVEVSVYKTEKQAAHEEKKDVMIYRLVIGAVLFVCGMVTSGTLSLVCALLSYIILGYDVLIKAVRNIMRGNMFDEHFLMGIATVAAIFLKDYKEAAGVMLFYQIGEYFQELAVRKSRNSIGALLDIRPDTAEVLRDGVYEEVDPQEVCIGEIIRVKPGERVPLDGTVIKGASSLDTSSITGEAKPYDVDQGDSVISGCVNQSGVLELSVTKEYGDSTVSRILDLVENSDSTKAEHEKFITSFSRYYTPTVVIAAVIVAVLVSVVTGEIYEGVYRACTFLVISCPCALVISIPLSFFAGIGGLSSRGILVKGADVIDSLAKVNTVVFDKTGTLTSGAFTVDHISGDNPERILEDAAAAEQMSSHPIARSIMEAYGKTPVADGVSIEEISGRGIVAKLQDRTVLAGNAKMMAEAGIDMGEAESEGTCVHVAENNVYLGTVYLKDRLKEDSAEAIAKLKKAGRTTAVVSGDNPEITAEIGKQLGMDHIYGGCLPEDKVNVIRNLKKDGNVVAFVGDGINDAPVLANSDVSVAMGGIGSDAAVEIADVVLMDDRPSAVSTAIDASIRIHNVANQNIVFAIGIKVMTLILGAFGIANMWMAIFADTGVAMLCVLNAMRLLRISRNH